MDFRDMFWVKYEALILAFWKDVCFFDLDEG